MDEVIPVGTMAVIGGPTELTTLGGSEWQLGEAETRTGFTTANSWLLLDLPPRWEPLFEVPERTPGRLGTPEHGDVIWDQLPMKPSGVAGLGTDACRGCT